MAPKKVTKLNTVCPKSTQEVSHGRMLLQVWVGYLGRAFLFVETEPGVPRIRDLKSKMEGPASSWMVQCAQLVFFGRYTLFGW